MDNIFGNRFMDRSQVPWHKKGFVANRDMTAVEVLKEFGEFEYIKRPVSYELNGKNVEVDYMLIRPPLKDDPREVAFNYVSKNYNIVQPMNVAMSYDKNVGSPVETMGMFGKGEKMFLTWALPDIDVKGDVVKCFGMVSVGYDGKHGASLWIVTLRVVCNNTYNIAVQRAENAKEEDVDKKLWVGRHNSGNVERDLGLWMEHVNNNTSTKLSDVAEMFNAMASVPLSNKDAKDLIWQIYPDNTKDYLEQPEILRLEKTAKADEYNDKMAKERSLAEMLFCDNRGTGITPDVWGLFNAITEKENFAGMVKKPIEQSVMVGNRQGNMERAFGILYDYTLDNYK